MPKEVLWQHSLRRLLTPLQPTRRRQSTSTQPPVQRSNIPADMCGSKAGSNLPTPGQGPNGEVSGDHILSPHLEVAHKVNISIVLSSGAISMLLVSIIVYCLIKKRLVRCCEGEGTNHDIALQEGNNRSKAQTMYLPPPTQLPSAPRALTLQPPHASTQLDLESAMAHLQSQNTALINQLTIQQQQQTKGASEGSRSNQYPVV